MWKNFKNETTQKDNSLNLRPRITEMILYTNAAHTEVYCKEKREQIGCILQV